MLCVDVNVLVYAHRADLPEHSAYRRLLAQLATDIDARGNDIADAYLAAYALEDNATWLSADRGFARFHRLRWTHPLER